jgi:taurine transport system ATP-binding protein
MSKEEQPMRRSDFINAILLSAAGQRSDIDAAHAAYRKDLEPFADTLVKLEGVAVGHGEPDTGRVLDPISLSVPEGGLCVLLGPPGCGKSSLLNVIAGFVQPASGRASVSGRPITGPGADRGVVFQDDALLPWLDVLGNVALALQLKGLPKAECQDKARHFLGLVGLAGQEGKSLWELSGDMRQRVDIARALAADPKVLLMDEPFGALDALARKRMQEMLLKVWQATGKTIVLVTREVEEAVFLASQLVVLSRRPANIAMHLLLGFGRRHAEGEAARSIKSRPEFVAVRERVRAEVLSQGADMERALP